MSIRKRKDSFIVEVYDPETQLKTYVSAKQLGMPVPKTMREAKALEREALARLDQVRPGAETVDHFAARWMEDFPEGRSEQTIKHNNERIKKIAKDFHGRPMNSIGRQEGEAWALQNRSRVREVRAMWNDAIRAGVVTDNPFKGIGYARTGRRDITVLTEAEVEQLCQYSIKVHGPGFGQEFAALIKWAAYTGMRPGEVMAAKWDNLVGDTYNVTQQFNTKLGRMTTPKYASNGMILVPEPALRSLGHLKRYNDGLMFHTRRGSAFSAVTLRDAWIQVRAAFGRPDLDLYELRHFCASYMLNQLGIEPWIIAQQLRHSDDGKLVVMLYGHPDRNRAIGRMRDAFSTVKGLDPVFSGNTSGDVTTDIPG